MMRIAATLVVLLVPSLLWAAVPPPELAIGTNETPEEQLARGKQAYAQSNYSLAIKTLRPLLYPDVLVAGNEEIIAHKLLGLSYFFERIIDLAEQEFTALLQLKEDFALDPLFDPPTAIQFIERIRYHNREKLTEIANQKLREQTEREKEREIKLREAAELACRNAKPTILERRIEKHFFALNFVPFGTGQWQNGQPRKAVAFMTTEIILGLASVALWGTLYFGYSGRALSVDDKKLADSLNYSQVIIGGLFWVDVVAGIIDAIVHYVPTTTITSTPTAFRPRIAPFALGDGGGLFVRGAF